MIIKWSLQTCASEDICDYWHEMFLVPLGKLSLKDTLMEMLYLPRVGFKTRIKNFDLSFSRAIGFMYLEKILKNTEK